MEHPPVMPAEVPPIRPLEFMLGSYKVRCALDHGKICVRAYSDISEKVFEGTVDESCLSEYEKFYFGDVPAVYSMLEECLLNGRKIRLSDAGELDFPYFFQVSKKHAIEKVFQVKLKEKEMTDTQRLAIKVERLEEKIQKNCQL